METSFYSKADLDRIAKQAVKDYNRMTKRVGKLAYWLVMANTEGMKLQVTINHEDGTAQTAWHVAI